MWKLGCQNPSCCCGWWCRGCYGCCPCHHCCFLPRHGWYHGQQHYSSHWHPERLQQPRQQPMRCQTARQASRGPHYCHCNNHEQTSVSTSTRAVEACSQSITLLQECLSASLMLGTDSARWVWYHQRIVACLADQLLLHFSPCCSPAVIAVVGVWAQL